MDYFPLLRPLIFRLQEENAHHLVLRALKHGFVPPQPRRDIPSLRTTVFGLDFPNPVGLAAGFDKHAEAINPLLAQGFGFIECGTVTPLPQTGNPKPRLFRLPENRAIINRMGFNSHGADVFEANFRAVVRKGIVGINIGKNKVSTDAVADYITLLKRFAGLGDYITLNISSPNTPNLRDLQQRGPLEDLLGAVRETGVTTPILLKIAPDITDTDKEYIAEMALKYALDGLIVSNTTISREGLKDTLHAAESGGLSGVPLFKLSTQVLKDMYRLTGGKIPLIGAGGTSNGAEAYAKIRAGASLIQIYTSLIYNGFSLINRINRELATLLEKDGFRHISEAVGMDNRLG